MSEPAEAGALELVGAGLLRGEGDLAWAVLREDDLLQVQVLAGEAVLGVLALEGDLDRFPGLQFDPAGLELELLRHDGDLAGLGRERREQKRDQKQPCKAWSGDSRDAHVPSPFHGSDSGSPSRHTFLHRPNRYSSPRNLGHSDLNQLLN